MICIYCRAELFPEPEPLGDDVKRWVDKTWGEWTCYNPETQSHPQLATHSPAYEISGALLDDIVEYLGEAAEIADRIGEEGAEQFAALAEQVSTETKLVMA